MIKLSFLSAWMIALSISLHASDVVLFSPDGNTRLLFENGSFLQWSVSYKSIPVLVNSAIGLEFSAEPPLGADMEIADTVISYHDSEWTPLYGTHRTIRNHYNELQIDLQEKNYPQRKFTLVFRAYNDGVAFRYLFPEQHNLAPSITREKTTFRFQEDYHAWIADYGGYYTHQEADFVPGKL
jgi:hypothetical protein